MPFSLEPPALQLDFAAALIQLRSSLLQDALLATVKHLPISEVDKQLSLYVSQDDLSTMASRGLRGEIAFAVPIILRANPRLIGYYRLLLGYSQKAFYGSSARTGIFKSMEDDGEISGKCNSMIEDLCRALAESSSYSLNRILPSSITSSFLDDLTLITLGPQLRGGANVKKGTRGNIDVFEAIKRIVQKHMVKETSRVIAIRNSAGRIVLVEFAPDPDIVIREQISASAEDFRNIIAIEIKGGTDFSNIHNRLGEAEKSHQKARAHGFVECWTVVNIDRIDIEMAKTESPSTNRFYRLSQIKIGQGKEYTDFENRIVSLIGIPSNSRRPRKKKAP